MTNSQLYLILMFICYAQLWKDNKMLLFSMGTLASAYELENDIITQETLDKMGHRLSTENQNRITMNAWNKLLRHMRND